MTARSEMNDQDLLRAYAESKDTEFLGAFFSRYQESLVRFVGKLLGDSETAQDVVQETFLQVARHPSRLLGVESCHNWLLRVARNIGVTHVRRSVRARRRAEHAAERTASDAAGAQATRDAALETEESRRRVRAEIDRLNPRHREILLLKIEENKSYKEIAEITGLTATNVGYLLHTAMQALSARLKPLREELQ